MTHTTQDMQGVLRRELAGTLGLLADAEDFAAMRRYRSFTFDDHDSYLRQVERLLSTRDRLGRRTTLALFDPEEYAHFCVETGLEPDTPTSRAAFTAELGATGPALPYDGRPLGELVDDLLDEAMRQATWEYATTLLSLSGSCAACGEDLGRAAHDRAAALLTRVLTVSGPGTHHLVCSVLSDTGTLVAALHADVPPGSAPADVDPGEALEFLTVLAVGLARAAPGGLVARTTNASGRDRIHGWRLRESVLLPLTAAEVFDAYCTDAETGDLVSPESGVDYAVAPDLGPQEGPHGHRF
ncbi:hypothetical protein HUT18_02470 [Streptomyces sp. NA04227]|uniref:hypothetical protein n=1 Tax=Streptomyces sp. NA04227 TaxID=2742136 RepID=UPI0015926531|nr:hypothetical protein [Streptomyces sp. NA04227]QKW05406.1 hypothetical protein HUT18_02470 [Streptomyces sp. NA04227]